MSDNEGYKSDLDKFQHFVFEMDDVLDAFHSETYKLGYSFDYSLESLDLLEVYIDKTIKSQDDTKSLTRVSRYLGEVFRKHLGGRWDLCLDDPKNINYKQPIINDFSEIDLEFCPMEIIGNYLINHRKGMIRKAVEANMEFRKGKK